MSSKNIRVKLNAINTCQQMLTFLFSTLKHTLKLDNLFEMKIQKPEAMPHSK